VTDLSCFLAYDIRGRVPEQIDAAFARNLGRAFVAELGARRVVLGRDVRLESPMLAEALIAGLTASGADVIDIGLCGTEEVYFATVHHGADGGIMVTASHNPKGYNGMKLVRAGAQPISGDTGLFAIRDRMTGSVASGHDPGEVASTARTHRDDAGERAGAALPGTADGGSPAVNPARGAAEQAVPADIAVVLPVASRVRCAWRRTRPRTSSTCWATSTAPRCFR
jgi:phosphomannomutase